MIFSKTFKSKAYSQIVCMLGYESSYTSGMRPLPVITFYFYHDGSVHSFNMSYSNTQRGLKLRAKDFEQLAFENLDTVIFNKLEESKI